jgi:sphingomyelin phosphodiesterase acid-like 3
MSVRNSLILVIVLLASFTLGACGQNPASSTPQATDYSQAAHWLSLPAPEVQPVDVFYFYPTAWTSTDTNPQICAIDEPSMLAQAPPAFARQATAFETVGNIYAPYYRQNNLSPVDRLNVIAGIPTLDAVAAFDYYIKHYNNGRSFILAGHSQGSNVLNNLLAGYMKDHPEVLKNMIAAYVIGFPVTATYLAQNPHLKFADGPDDTGVIISYNTEAPDVPPGTNPVLSGMVGLVINPITWTRDETLATTAEGLGSFLPNPATQNYSQVPQYADAKIDKTNGVLICSTANVEELSPGNQMLAMGIYHNFDYPFYYYNIRANAQNRVNKYLAGSGTSTTATSFPVVVFSDVHFNPFYDPSLVPALISAEADEWAGIFKTSSITAPSAWGTDTNYPSLELALSSIKQNLGSSPLVIYTGDVLGHGIPQYFYTTLTGTINPRTPTEVAAMKAFTDKTAAFVMGQVRASVGNIPVLFAVGNCDSYSGHGPTSPDSNFSPSSTFLPDTAELFYSKFLNSTVDYKDFLSSFTSAGYYSAEPAGTNLMVIGLNTIVFSPGVPGDNDSIVNTELAWFDSRLASAKSDGKKVWLLMHAPPGADIGTTAESVGSNGQIASATMMWKPAYQTSFLQVLAKYPGIITLMLAGHTHMDEYRIPSSSDVLEITPAISPFFGNNPAFKVFTFASDTSKPTDYRSLNYDLAATPAPGQFNSYYTFSIAYSMPGLLGDSLAQLFPTLAIDSAKQALYRGYYYSGHNSPNSAADTHLNTITNTNWPVYWSGIGKMGQQELIDSVNSSPSPS